MFTSTPATDGTIAASQDKKKDRHIPKHLAGFIFMCNRSTKPQCYQYRVFGLPMAKRKVVERIIPGTKLFLFDFELKILYGVYEATSSGNIDLEPTAFEGKFPAQVRFRIFKECLPLPEKFFKSAIQDNYRGVKFEPELNEEQVRSLLSVFPPLAASSSNPVPFHMPNAATTHILPPRGMEEQYKYLLSPDYPYLSMVPHFHASPIVDPQPMQHLQYATAAAVDHSLRAVKHQGFQVASHYSTDSQQPYFTGGNAQIVQDPYSSYHHQLAMPRERENAMNGENIPAYYSTATVPVSSSTMQPQAPAYGTPQLNISTTYFHS